MPSQMSSRKGPIGLYNSSITRVRPVFQNLKELDRQGTSWLPRLLALGSTGPALPDKIINSPGRLLPDTFQNRDYVDRVLASHGVEQPIKLENCFERSLPPPKSFLRWLILNLGDVWDGTKRKNSTHSAQRRGLLGMDTQQSRSAATQTALKLLDEHGTANSRRQWWAFEGFTEVDCFLETDSLILLIEGKRTEPISSSTMWYPDRDQIVRNLEVAEEAARRRDKVSALLLISENIMEFDLDHKLRVGLPHLDDETRRKVGDRFLGCTTWRAVCDSTGLNFEELPETSAVVATQLAHERE